MTSSTQAIMQSNFLIQSRIILRDICLPLPEGKKQCPFPFDNTAKGDHT